VHLANDTRENRTVANTRVEEANRGLLRFDQVQFACNALGHHPLFRAGVDEQQIVLPVVIKAKILSRIIGFFGQAF